jgi:hypothetical protein
MMQLRIRDLEIEIDAMSVLAPDYVHPDDVWMVDAYRTEFEQLTATPTYAVVPLVLASADAPLRTKAHAAVVDGVERSVALHVHSDWQVRVLEGPAALGPWRIEVDDDSTTVMDIVDVNDNATIATQVLPADGSLLCGALPAMNPLRVPRHFPLAHLPHTVPCVLDISLGALFDPEWRDHLQAHEATLVEYFEVHRVRHIRLVEWHDKLAAGAQRLLITSARQEPPPDLFAPRVA